MNKTKDGKSKEKIDSEDLGSMKDIKDKNIRITALGDLSEKEEAEERYMRLVENSPQITYVFSKKKGAIFWLAKVEEILGHTQEDLLNDPHLWTKSIHEEDWNYIKEKVFNNEVKPGAVFEYRIYDTKGRMHWFKDTIFSVIIKDDDVIYKGICIDITEQIEDNSERRNTEKKIKESETKMQFLASSAMEIAELKSLADIYEYIGNKLYDFTEGNAVVVVSEYDSTGFNFEIKENNY